MYAHPFHSILFAAGLGALSLSACAGGEAPPGANAGVQLARATTGATTDAAAQSFEAWVADLRVEALASGISADTFDRAFAGVRPDPQVLALDLDQPEFERPIWDYLDAAVSDRRVATGRERLAEQRALLEQVGGSAGVEPRVVVAIWGLESAYGANVGSSDVIRSLATLAYQGRRREAFRTFLLQALRILQDGEIARHRMIGSWAGAMGQTQFMPGAYLEYAVDHDGDGRRDLWGSLPDVFASTANYLNRHGWQAGESWGLEVVLPPGFDYALADPVERRSVAEWQALGVRPVAGGDLPPSTAGAAILLPAGHRGPAFMILQNFRVIMRYNNATSYALAVGHLADRIGGGPPIRAAWPRGDVPLSRDDRIDLQGLLTSLGYDTGGIDGIVGPNTRAALRAYQRDQGLPADGYPTREILDRLREAA